MRVAVITSYFPSSAQPWQGRSAFQTLRLLARELPLKVFYPESRYPALLTPRSRTFARLDPAFRPRDAHGVPEVDVEYIPFPVLPVVSRPLNGLLAARALLPRVRAWQPDLLLSYVIYPDGYAALRLARALRLPLVTTAIGSDLNRIPDRFVGRRIAETLREATLTTTVSADLARTAVRLGAPPARTRPILNGCDLAVFHPRNRTHARRALGLLDTHTLPDVIDPPEALGPPEALNPQSALSPEDALGPAKKTGSGNSAQIALYVGRMDLAKGLIELVEAAARLHARRPALRLYLLGHGPDEPRIRQRIAALNAGSYITVNPAVSMEEVAVWMAAADLVTLPSYCEGCPNVIIEALAAGRPVVATNVGGIPELLDNTSGRMVPPRDVPALEHALDEALAATWDPEALHRAPQSHLAERRPQPPHPAQGSCRDMKTRHQPGRCLAGFHPILRGRARHGSTQLRSALGEAPRKSGQTSQKLASVNRISKNKLRGRGALLLNPNAKTSSAAKYTPDLHETGLKPQRDTVSSAWRLPGSTLQNTLVRESTGLIVTSASFLIRCGIRSGRDGTSGIPTSLSL